MSSQLSSFKLFLMAEGRFDMIKKIIIVFALGAVAYVVLPQFLMGDKARIEKLIFNLMDDLSPIKPATQVNVLQQAKAVLAVKNESFELHMSGVRPGQTIHIDKFEDIKLGLYQYFYNFAGMKLKASNLELQIEADTAQVSLEIQADKAPTPLSHITCQIQLKLRKSEFWKLTRAEGQCSPIQE